MTMGHDRDEQIRTSLEALGAFLATLSDPIDTHGGYDGNALSKRMREDLASAVAAGVLPTGIKLSVRKEHYGSYQVEITAWPTAVFSDEYLDHVLDSDKKEKPYIPPGGELRSQPYTTEHAERLRHADDRLTLALQLALVAVDRIVERHNYNNSDAMTDYFDVGYYMTVSARAVIAAANYGIRLERDPAFRDLVQRGHDAAKALGDACTKSVCGRGGIADASEYELDRLIKMADKAKGRPVVYSKRRHGWIIDDSAPLQRVAVDTKPTAATYRAKDAEHASKRVADLPAESFELTMEDAPVTQGVKVPIRVPECAASMGCLCALHARGGGASEACDAREKPVATCTHPRTVDGGRYYVVPTSFCLDCAAVIKRASW